MLKYTMVAKRTEHQGSVIPIDGKWAILNRGYLLAFNAIGTRSRMSAFLAGIRLGREYSIEGDRSHSTMTASKNDKDIVVDVTKSGKLVSAVGYRFSQFDVTATSEECANAIFVVVPRGYETKQILRKRLDTLSDVPLPVEDEFLRFMVEYLVSKRRLHYLVNDGNVVKPDSRSHDLTYYLKLCGDFSDFESIIYLNPDQEEILAGVIEYLKRVSHAS